MKLPAISEELKLRIQYGVLLFASAIFLVSVGGFFYVSALVFLGVICSAEAFLIISKRYSLEEIPKKIVYKTALAISIPLISLYVIREEVYRGTIMLLWLCILIAVVDTGAYFCGRFFGKHKLASSISPSKTIEGFAGGVLFATLLSLCFYYIFKSQLPLFAFMIISFVIAVLAQVSDLSQSYFKRQFDVKDSSNLIPGHGGFLDRLDGYMLTAPTVVVFYFSIKSIFGLTIFG